MKTGPRSFHSATLLVSPSDALPKHLREVFEITSLFVPEEDRGKGLARELIKRTVAEADQTETVLMLIADPASLKAFYAKHGFEQIQESPCLMARAAKKRVRRNPLIIRAVASALN